MRRLLAALAVATLAACEGLEGPLMYTIDGTWSGSSAGQTLVLNLTQGGSSVVGTGTLSGSSTGTRNLSVTGDFASPLLTAVLSSSTGQPITLRGTVAGKSLAATLTGAGFTGDAISMTRP